jgi:hypothetical protein
VSSSVVNSNSRTRLTSFDYPDVKLLDGPLCHQYERTHDFFLKLDEDRLLKVYRQRAGLPAPGDDMGGWYDANGLTPGCCGQFISALARFGSATNDSATKAKVTRLVKGLAETMGPDGNPFAVEGSALRNPAYLIDKHAVGLLDAAKLIGTPGCLDFLDRAWKFAVELLLPYPVEIMSPAIGSQPDELYTLPENLYYAYEVSGKDYYRELARRYLFNEFFDPLARGEDALVGRHAYSHVNALGSAARAYLVDGDSKYLEAMQNAFDLIEAQQYASGGYGPNETFISPGSDALFEMLTASANHFEVPDCAYAQFKLVRYLIRITGESRYGDSMERILYNGILGAKEIQEDGRSFYYADYRTCAAKRYYHAAWPCCSGTYPQVIADYGISTYFRDRAGIYVNLYVPSELQWQINGESIKLIQNTTYPLGDRSTITVRTPTPQEFAISLRIPGWAKLPVKITVNGKREDVDTQPKKFASIHRRWKDQDTIEILFPTHLRTVPLNAHHPRTVALMRGPLLYVSSNPEIKLPSPGELERLTPVPVLKRTEWFELPGVRSGDGCTAYFMPYYTVGDESYTTYLQQTLDFPAGG